MNPPRHVLFLCTGNSARSILAEALLGRHGGGRFRAHSAGSAPKGAVHPTALALLGERGFSIDRLRSKSWDEFAGRGAPPIDIVITVCDAAAGETCPIWPGRRTTAHWGMDDPAAVEGPAQRAAFERAFNHLERRIAHFIELPFDKLDRPELKAELARIAALAPAPVHD